MTLHVKSRLLAYASLGEAHHVVTIEASGSGADSYRLPDALTEPKRPANQHSLETIIVNSRGVQGIAEP